MILLGAILLALFVLDPPYEVPVVAAAVAVEAGEAFLWIWLSRRRRVAVGVEALIGQTAEVVTPCRPFGQVRVQGELWRARCDGGVDAGDVVRVRALEGLTLLVER
jgi:membrane-bound serine protease (ClpP class)